MIVEIRYLKATCKHEGCSARADFSVTRTNDELEGRLSPGGYPYVTAGTRIERYCRRHLPQDARASWNATEVDAGLAPTDFEEE